MENYYYKTLGISKGSKIDEIKKAYRKLALKYHPDKNKTVDAVDKFKELGESYEVLSEKNKREIYDRHEENGIKLDPYQESCSHKFSYTFHCDPKATFDHFFGSSDPFDNSNSMCNDEKNIANRFIQILHNPPGMAELKSRSFNKYSSPIEQNKRKVQNSVFEHILYVSLENILTGCTKKIIVSRPILLGNGTFGKQDKILTVNVKPGWKSGTKITYIYDGDYGKYNMPTDIVFIIKDKPHRIFKRDGNDIRYTTSISLKQALCGTEIVVPTLTDKKITLNLKSEIINPTVKRLLGYGLSFFKEPARRGDLLVSFDIQFPKILSPAVRDILYEVLP